MGPNETNGGFFRTRGRFGFWGLLFLLAVLVALGIHHIVRQTCPVGDDEIFYLVQAQSDVVKFQERSYPRYLWHVFHDSIPAKEPGWRLAAEPVIQGYGVNLVALRVYALGFLVPSALLIYFGMRYVADDWAALTAAGLLATSYSILSGFMAFMMEYVLYLAMCAVIFCLFRQHALNRSRRYPWVCLGMVLGLGCYTKSSFLMPVAVLLGGYWLWSWRWSDGRQRRGALYKSMVLAALLASFWWSYHFPRALAYAWYAFSGHRYEGTGVGVVRFWNWFRALFFVGVGLWDSLLMLGGILIPLGVLIGRRWKPPRNPQEDSGWVTELWLLICGTLAILLVLNYLGHVHHPRLMSILVPLLCVASGLGLGIAHLSSRKAYPVLLALLLTLQVVSMYVSPLRPETGDVWFRATPFSPEPCADFSSLPRLMTLPADRPLQIAIVGNSLTFTPHSIRYPFFPNPQRVEVYRPYTVSSADVRAKVDDLGQVWDRLVETSSDYVIVLCNPQGRQFGTLPHERDMYLKENQYDQDIARRLEASQDFEGPQIVRISDTPPVTIWVFRRLPLGKPTSAPACE